LRASGRRLTVFLGPALVADRRAPLAVFESGFAPRWYVPRRDVVPSVLVDVSLDGQPLLPAAHQEIEAARSDRDLDVETRDLSLVSQTASAARYSRHAHTQIVPRG